MNGSSNPSPELPIPMPSPELGVESSEAHTGLEGKTSTADKVSPGPSTAMPAVDPSQYAVAQTGPVAVTDDQDDIVGADDSDVIEKEWVTKAKVIVDKTRNNPSEQSNELSKFKAEYLKKRFNKEAKATEEVLESS